MKKSGKRLRAFLCSDVLVLTDENAKALYRMVRSRPEGRSLSLTFLGISSLSHFQNWP